MKAFVISTVLILSGCGFYDANDKVNLIISCASGDFEKVKEFSEKVRSLDYVSIKGDTPLVAASYNGHLTVVKYLIQKGATCNFPDELGNTAKSVALERGYKDIVGFLQADSTCTK
ncbi:ankyrin repeat domain-containing protein [Microbulbifer sp. SAOS-129_SWC]|uniref:ankyrin repeat domain-containing protein n=1 Tax=Microbulbifer sp. SAOS-129_SWC TaxID=3145235 RepID=UPI0032163789